MISKFDEFNIHKICKEYGIKNYTINNGLVDVDGSVYLANRNLTKLPLKFGKVGGDFICSNKLISLKGAPDYVGGYFACSYNQLASLKGAPKEVTGDFYCNSNKLITLEGAPREVGGDFLCDSNQLPKEIINFKDIKYIVKWQDEYNIWRNGKLDLFRFNELIKDYDK